MPVAVGSSLVGMAVGSTPLAAAYVGDVQVFAPGGFDPLSLGWDVAMWAEDPGQTPPGEGDSVGAWRNAGSSGVGWTGGVSYSSSGLNGKPTLYGGANVLQSSRYVGGTGTPLTTVVIGYRNPSGIMVNGPSLDRQPNSNYMAYSLNFGTELIATGITDTNTPHLFSMVYQQRGGGQGWIDIDGVRKATAASTSGASAGNKIAYLGWGSGTGQWKIAFYGTTQRELTAQENADLLAWSRSHYGTP